MNARQQMYYLIEHYMLGDYDTQTFADEFEFAFFRKEDIDDEIPDNLTEKLSTEEHEAFYELATMAGRTSCYRKDLQTVPNPYFTEYDLRKKVIEICGKVNIKEIKTPNKHILDELKKSFKRYTKTTLYQLIEHYMLGEYDTQTYSDKFTEIYQNVITKNDFSSEENILFEELYNIAKKVSCYLDDLQRFPGKFASECEIRKKTIEVCKKLNIKY